ncbi:MAG: PH domain-containing protein, partial [Phycisphaerales bacterium]|nr:PH domain-containing protein [Phycisphaerales bacterium]
MSASPSPSQTNPPAGVPRCERVVVHDRPHVLFVLTGAYKWILFGGALWILLLLAGGRTGYPVLASIGWGVMWVVVARIVVGMIDWVVRIHVLTDARIVAQFGILRTIKTDLPLRRVQHLVLVRPLIERIFGLGSIGVASAGTGSIEVVWRAVDRPQEVLAQIREQITRAV